MHMGQTEGRDCGRPWLRLANGPDGAISRDGRVRGCYVQGLFAADELRSAFLGNLRARNSSGATNYEVHVNEVLDAWASHLEAHLDVERLLSFAR
jgi:adenosylcobyric acid synthase